jgi:hypothetical protein
MEKDVAKDEPKEPFDVPEVCTMVLSHCGQIAHWMMAQVSREWRIRASDSLRRRFLAQWKSERQHYPVLHRHIAHDFQRDESIIAGCFGVIARDDLDPLPRCRFILAARIFTFSRKALQQELVDDYLRVQVASDPRLVRTLYAWCPHDYGLLALQRLSRRDALVVLVALGSMTTPDHMDKLRILSGRVDCLDWDEHHVPGSTSFGIASESMPVVKYLVGKEAGFRWHHWARELCCAMVCHVSLTFFEELLATIEEDRDTRDPTHAISMAYFLRDLGSPRVDGGESSLVDYLIRLVPAIRRWWVVSMDTVVLLLAHQHSSALFVLDIVKAAHHFNIDLSTGWLMLREPNKSVCPYEVDKLKHPGFYAACACHHHRSERARDELGPLMAKKEEKPHGARGIPIHPLGVVPALDPVQFNAGAAMREFDFVGGGQGGVIRRHGGPRQVPPFDAAAYQREMANMWGRMMAPQALDGPGIDFDALLALAQVGDDVEGIPPLVD